MSRNKKTPMYESITGPNENKTFDFVDYTSPIPPKQPSLTPDPQLIKKIQSLYRSQLLNIEQLKEQENHGEELSQTHEQSFKQEKILTDRSNSTQQPFSKILRLETHQTLGTVDDGEQSYPFQSTADIKYPFSNSPFYIRKSKKAFTFELENIKDFKQKPLLTNIKNASYSTPLSEFTSDDIINMMTDPYKSSLQYLKRRIRNNSNKML